MTYKRLNELKNETLDPVSFYSKKLDKTFGMHRHCHGYYEIMYCIEGSFQFEYSHDGTNYTAVRINPNEFVFINAGLMHSIYVDGEYSAVVGNVELKPQRRERSILKKADGILSVEYGGLIAADSGLRYMATRDLIHMPDSENVKFAVTRLVECLATGDYDDAETACGLRSMIVFLLLEIGKCVKNITKDAGVTYIKRAKEYVRANCFGKFSLDGMAKSVGVNKAYLQRLFKSYDGRTVMQYVTQLRLERARNLLLNTSEPIGIVCREVGFGTQQQFINVFKKATGVTPSEYRRNAGETVFDHALEPYESVKQDYRRGKEIKDGHLF